MARSKLPELREYRIWAGMRARCFNPRSPFYHRYGGRGIQICDRWKLSFWDFLSDMGRCPPGLTIERVDNDGNYEPSNCTWASRREQCQNRIGLRKIQGFTMAEWSRRTGIPEGTIRSRLKLGWTDVDALRVGNFNVVKLSSGHIPKIRQRIKEGLTHQQIADEFGVDRSTITAVTCGKNWKQEWLAERAMQTDLELAL